MTIEELTIELEKLLKTDEPEYDGCKYNKNNWQAKTARDIAYRILEAANADGMGGCSLCQM
jgi:hypothetical protein